MLYGTQSLDGTHPKETFKFRILKEKTSMSEERIHEKKTSLEVLGHVSNVNSFISNAFLEHTTIPFVKKTSVIS